VSCFQCASSSEQASAELAHWNRINAAANGPAWASNDALSKALARTRVPQHLATRTPHCWAPTHTFVEPGHERLPLESFPTTAEVEAHATWSSAKGTWAKVAEPLC
jgi:hypothetical protein